MEKFWQKQFDQNYSRSLDHRSFYFKSIDKKVLGNRHILGELREASDANANRPEAALSIHAGVPEAIRLRPDLVLGMPEKCAAPGHRRAAPAFAASMRVRSVRRCCVMIAHAFVVTTEAAAGACTTTCGCSCKRRRCSCWAPTARRK